MAQKDFYGTWNVLNTTGTNFGTGSTVTIQPMAGGGDTEVNVTITIPTPGTAQTGAYSVSGSYEAVADAVVVVTGTQTMFISRYVDVAGSFYAIYGMTVDDTGSTPRYSMAIWVAQAPSANVTLRTSGFQPEFDGNYVVRSAVNAQFGIGSGVEIRSGGTAVTITNAFNEPVPGPQSFQFDLSTCSLRGSATINGQEVVVQISLASPATLTGIRWVYGLAIVGDPEQAGAWGAEDDGT